MCGSLRNELALYQSECGSPDEAVNTYKDAVEAMPYSLLMHFMYADFEESRKHTEVSAQSLWSLINIHTLPSRILSHSPTYTSVLVCFCSLFTVHLLSLYSHLAFPLVTFFLMTQQLSYSPLLSFFALSQEAWRIYEELAMRNPDPLVYINFLWFVRRSNVSIMHHHAHRLCLCVCMWPHITPSTS